MGAKWHNKENFPESAGSWELLVAPFHYRTTGEAKVKRALKRALPLNPVLVSTPATNRRFLPPITINRESIAARIARNTHIMFYMTLTFWLVGTVIILLARELEFAAIWWIAFGSVTWQAHHIKVVSSDLQSLEERWQFFAWCSTKGASFAFSFLGFMIFLAIVQIIGAEILNGNGFLLDRYGLLYDAPWRGEFWRLFTAPYLHINVAHWLTNTVVGTGLMVIVGPSCGWRMILWALIPISILSLATTSLLSPIVDWGASGIVGISGGISGLIGVLLAATLTHDDLFPAAFSKSIALTALVLLLATSVIMNFGGSAAHLFGLLLGLMSGLIMNPVSTHFTEEPVDASCGAGLQDIRS